MLLNLNLHNVTIDNSQSHFDVGMNWSAVILYIMKSGRDYVVEIFENMAVNFCALCIVPFR